MFVAALLVCLIEIEDGGSFQSKLDAMNLDIVDRQQEISDM